MFFALPDYEISLPLYEAVLHFEGEHGDVETNRYFWLVFVHGEEYAIGGGREASWNKAQDAVIAAVRAYEQRKKGAEENSPNAP
jgi:hypothetical protein